MWIAKEKMVAFEVTNAKLNEEVKTLQILQHVKVLGLERMNARLQADLDWFKHRLNQVERERGQLIQAACGIKIAVPEFVPTFEDPAEALNQMPDLSSVGDDAKQQDDTPGMDLTGDVDYSLMPGYMGKRAGA